MVTASTLWITTGVWLILRQCADEKYPLETGGVLLGYEANSREIVVTASVGPGPDAQHSLYGFVPDYEYQEEAVAAHYNKTSGVETYLGDWHSHPDGAAALSRRDKKTMRNIASSPESGVTMPVMLVLTGSSGHWVPNAFRLRSWSRRLLSYGHRIEELVTSFG